MPPRFPPRARPFLAALSCAAATSLALALWRAWNESVLQGWGELGLSWMTLERLASERALAPALGAGVLVLGALLAARRLRARPLPLAVVGHPLCALAALLLAFVLP